MRAIPLLFALLIAGCASGPVAPSSTTPALQFDDGAASKVDVPVLPTAPPLAGERTLATAPKWRLGEYWNYTVTDHFVGNTVQIQRVVAGSFGPNYLVGFPVDAFSNDVLVLHVPGYGDIDMADLSFEVHDADMQLLSFPLTVGKTWPTAWQGAPGNATVLAADGSQATIQLVGSGGFNWTAVYDAQTGDLVRLSDPNYATVELTGHGYGYQGVVRVPHAHDLIFQNGRVGPWAIGQDPSEDPVPASTTETIHVAAGYDRLGFVLIAGGGPELLIPNLPPTVGGGSYSEKVMAPDGTVFELSSGPTETGFKVQFFGAGDPAGNWTLEHHADGPGLVLTEGIGYHSIDIDLPSGCVLPGVNAGHHLDPCTDRLGEPQTASR